MNVTEECMAKKHRRYRVLQRETLDGWLILDGERDDECVAKCATRWDARKKAREMNHVEPPAAPPAAA